MTHVTETDNQRLGLFLSDWDERLGPRVLAQNLPDINEDAESLATQSYMSAQQVFSSAEFSRISFTLPNLKIQRKIKLYFDVVQDDAVRGGRRPFLLAVLTSISAPDSLFASIDPIIEQAQETYKQGTLPDFKELQDQCQQASVNALQDILPEEFGVEMAGPAEDHNPREDVIFIKVYCEICQRDVPIAFSRAEIKQLPGNDLSEFTYMHGFDETGTDPHGLRVTVDPQDAIAKLEYVDTGGSRISPVQDQELRTLPQRAGPWTPRELELLANEVRNGTPARSLARLFQRPVGEVTQKIQEIEKDKLSRFNKFLAESTAEAKSLEASDPLRAKKLWAKIAEYCLEFSNTSGLAPNVAAMIRNRTKAILERARMA